ALSGTTAVSAWNVATGGDWTGFGNWSSGVPNGVDAEADFFSAINATRTIFADTPITLGTMRFNNANMYHVTGGASLTMQVSTGSALIDVQAGTHKINLPLIIASNTNLNVAGGVTSSANGNLTPVGVATAQQTGRAGGTFGGLSVAATDVVVMFTYGGDANLDGKINVDDYGRIDFNVGLGTSGWYNGDFNYD